MARGNPENLRAAAQRKRQAATARAETALQKLITDGEPVTFRGLAKTAGVSIDFLCRSPLRARVEQLRADQWRTRPARARPSQTSRRRRAVSCARSPPSSPSSSATTAPRSHGSKLRLPPPKARTLTSGEGLGDQLGVSHSSHGPTAVRPARRRA
jgi:hypothetical protein